MEILKTRIISFVFLICSLIVTVKADLYVNAESATVSEGTRTSFTCYSADLTDPNIFSTGGKVVWCRYPRYSSGFEQIAQYTMASNGEILLTDPSDAERFEIEGGWGSHTEINWNLVIRTTSKSDQGRYSCILYNGSGQLISQSEKLSLTVKYPPADYFPFCTASPADVGTGVNLKCQSENTTPPVSVQWYRDNVKVADGFVVDRRTTSQYEARHEELGSQFECRLFYDDGSGIREERSCRFSRPFVAILRKVGEVKTGETTYNAFAHSNPPFVEDINCSLESSTGTRLKFQSEFPGYGQVTIGAVAPADNGTDLVCQATNVFGSGSTRMPVYSDGSQNGEATSPSVVTNYMAVEGILNASIWPKRPLVKAGDNVTFVCSYSLETHSTSRARVVTRWRYNDTPVDVTMSKFAITENSLQVKGIAKDDDNVIVSCLVTLTVDDATVVNIPADESATQIRFSSEPVKDNCLSGENGSTAFQSQSGDSSIFRSPSFLIGISVFAGIGWILCVIFILMIIERNRKMNQLSMSHTRRMSSQMTYRADSTTMTNGRHRGSIPSTNPTIRALPEQPSLRQVRSEPSSAPSGHHLEVPVESSRPELAYQEMVGNTGVMGSRNGDTVRSNGAVNGIAKGGMSDGSSSQQALVPGPNGGFIPPEMLASNISSENSRGSDGAELAYEDLDCMRHHEQQHTRRATGNDYQTSISNTPYMQPPEEQELLPHYANS